MTNIGLYQLTNVGYYNNGIRSDLIRVNTQCDTFYLRYKKDNWEIRWRKPFPSPNWTVKPVKDAETIATLESYIADKITINK